MGVHGGQRKDRCFWGFSDIDAVLAGVSESSAAWGDYDNDGDLDLLIAGSATSSPDPARVYHNDNGIFTDIGAGLAAVQSSAAAWGDYDNDGDLDIVLSGWNGGPLTKLYRNDGGAYTAVDAGLTNVSSGTLAWGDYDNDGDQDLLVTGRATDNEVAKLYRNDDGNFTDSGASLLGVSNSSAAWGDYENDGDLDLLLTGAYAPARSYSVRTSLYRNDSGIFTDVNSSLIDVRSGSVAWGDYDNDGALDILLTGSSPLPEPPPEVYSVAKVYRNVAGTFGDINADLIGAGLSSAAWGDYDNDGDLDLLFAGFNGDAFGGTLPPYAHIYRNDSGSFTAIPNNLTNTEFGALALGDYDNDGDLDIVLTGRARTAPWPRSIVTMIVSPLQSSGLARGKA